MTEKDCDFRHGEIDRRLAAHDAEIEQLWTTMRQEDAAIRSENGKQFESIVRLLGEIDGYIKAKLK